MKYTVQDIEITSSEDGADTVASAKCVLVSDSASKHFAQDSIGQAALANLKQGD